MAITEGRLFTFCIRYVYLNVCLIISQIVALFLVGSIKDIYRFFLRDKILMDLSYLGIGHSFII